MLVTEVLENVMMTTDMYTYPDQPLSYIMVDSITTIDWYGYPCTNELKSAWVITPEYDYLYLKVWDILENSSNCRQMYWKGWKGNKSPRSHAVKYNDIL